MIAADRSAYELLHRGTLALARVEENGVRIDTKYLKKAMAETEAKARAIHEELKVTKEYKLWRRHYGHKANLGSVPQLGYVFFGLLGLRVPGQDGKVNVTRTGRLKADEATLEKLDHPFIKKYFKAKKYLNMNATFLGGIRKHVDSDGYLRPSFNLHIPITYRSSSDGPNFQNYPVRRGEFAEIVRSCFIPRGDDYLFGEVDFSGAEVRVAACYNHDPVLVKYIKENGDMHMDMAREVYKLDPDAQAKDHKDARYCAKNKFVFPEFYGSYFRDCSRNLWEAIDIMSLKVGDVPMGKWLKSKGVRGPGNFDGDPLPGTFEHHVKKVEERFWQKFKVYKAWKERWIRDYEKNGGYKLLSGFAINGVFRRNEIINGAIQGTAFHCLLYILIEFQAWLQKYKMKTRIVGQIHDSMECDFHKAELEDCLHYLHWLISVKMPRHWPWLVVPMELEAEIAPDGKSWFHKKKIPSMVAPAGRSLLAWDGTDSKWVWR